VVFFPSAKRLEVALGVVGNEFFSILPKFLNWETVLDTLGDALSLNCILHGFYRNFDSPLDKTTHPINIKGHD
jgi:hypothetical protein